MLDEWSNYLVFLTIQTAIFAIFSLGLNLQWGFTGLINFGHVAFMTVGAYATVLLSLQGVPLFFAVLMGAVLATVLGILIGLSTLRLREDYLAIVTIGVSELIRLVALNEEWLTKGSFGVQSYRLPLEDFNPNLGSKLVMLGLLTLMAVWAWWQIGQWFRKQLPQPQSKSQNRQGGEQIVLLGLAAMAGALILAIYASGATALY
ncbi:MAG: branched-chain amino acid ABC transporter permease, partial [Symploca sp. SIO1C4]|nr:branched-chain amino acid ABC transporter permease [Symploca sp. SIO1C4]